MQLSYADTMLINPLGFMVLLLCCLALLLVERRYAFWPILIMVFFVSQAQRIVIFSLDFNQMRILVLVGLVRILFKGELAGLKRHKLDYLIIGYALVWALAHIARDGGGAIVFSLGQIVDLIVPYFVFRCLVQNYEDLINTVKLMSILTIFLSVFFIYESQTGRNIFSIFGGVPEFTDIRQGRLRCQGAFSHPIIAGVYFAVIVPLFAALWWNKNKVLATAGLVAALLIIVTSASSTPVFALLSALLAALFFYFRKNMKRIRWSAFSLLVLLHFIMKAPVWHLISRVSATGGSTSYFRYMLIDTTINNFSSWWLFGSSAYIGWYAYGMHDLTNQYVLSAISGGFFSLILFISILAVAFGAVGRSWRCNKENREKMIMIWALGCSLFALAMSFIGVALWGQLIILWPMLLAMIVSIDNHKSDVNI